LSATLAPKRSTVTGLGGLCLGGRLRRCLESGNRRGTTVVTSTSTVAREHCRAWDGVAVEVGVDVGGISRVCLFESTRDLDLRTWNSATAAIEVDLSTASVKLRKASWPWVVDSHTRDPQEVLAVRDAHGKIESVAD
jgi:hypothetical protein